MKGDLPFAGGGDFLVGRGGPRWLKRLDFCSCTDEAGKRRHEYTFSGSLIGNE